MLNISMRGCPARVHRALLAAAGLLALTGCASFSPDGGFDAVEGMTRARIGQAPTYVRTAAQADAARARVAALLRQPLTADAAVQVALLNNPELQADYAALGLAEADLVRAGRLANPSLKWGRLGGEGSVEVERAVVFDLLGLLTLPLAREVEQRRFEQVQMQAATQTLSVAAQARATYFEAVAARELAQAHEQLVEVVSTSEELAGRAGKVGNLAPLPRMREQAQLAEARLALVRARHREASAREQLVRALGLAGAQLAFELPARLPQLPALPDSPTAQADSEQAAMDGRLDLLRARRAAEETARSLGLARSTRVVNVLHLGLHDKRESGAHSSRGWEVEFVLPLFDFGQVRMQQAQALYMQAVNRAAAAAVRARSEVREAWSARRTAHEVAREHRDVLVPLRKRMSEEMLLRYNAMLVSPFELLADAREQQGAVIGSIEALRDFWLAETALQATLSVPAPSAAARSSDRSPAGRAAAAPAHAAGH